MLAKYRGHLECVRTCIDRNQAVIREILRERVLYPPEETGENPSADRWEFDEPPPNVRHGDMDQVNDIHTEHSLHPHPKAHPRNFSFHDKQALPKMTIPYFLHFCN